MSEPKIKPEEIPAKLLAAISQHLEVHETIKNEWQIKLSELTKVFLNSEATVYCEDCGLVFYSGSARPVALEKDYVDWKMLSFRHVWDTQHKVKVYLPFFLAQAAMIKQKNPAMYGFTKYAVKSLKFDDNMQVEYYLAVEEMRESLAGTPEFTRTNDMNWDENSSCFCSVCKKEYYDPKKACLCHSESKPWLPLGEVESIKVRRF
jgi:hypothetical protein